MTHTFKYTGSLLGRTAFTLESEELAHKFKSLRNSAAFSAGATDIEHHTQAERPADEETAIPASDWCGHGWYVIYWDGSAVHFDNETDALISYIEDRTETQAQ